MATRWVQRGAVVITLALGCCLFTLPGLVNTVQAQGTTCSASPFPQCGGSCPQGQICSGNTVTRQCECAAIPCQQSAPPQCGGTCPAPGFCQPDSAGVCQCGPVPCDQAPFPQCGGVCANGA